MSSRQPSRDKQEVLWPAVNEALTGLSETVPLRFCTLPLDACEIALEPPPQLRTSHPRRWLALPLTTIVQGGTSAIKGRRSTTVTGER